MSRVDVTLGQSTPTRSAEPEDWWKAELHDRIKRNLQSLADDAKRTLDEELVQGPVDDVKRQRLYEKHTQAMKAITQMAEEQYRAELQKERQMRRQLGGHPVQDGWEDVLVKQQQAIMQDIERETKARSRSNTLEDANRQDLPVFANGRPPQPSYGHPPSKQADPVSVPRALPQLRADRNPSISPSDDFRAHLSQRRPSNLSDRRPHGLGDGRPRVDSVGSVGEDSATRWLPVDPDETVRQPEFSARQRGDSAGSGKNASDGPLNPWPTHLPSDNTNKLSRRPTRSDSAGKPVLNNRLGTPSWKATIPTDDRSMSSLTLSRAAADAPSSELDYGGTSPCLFRVH
jgi:hypothetical protein